MKWYRAKQSQKKWDNFKGVLFFCLTVFLALSLFSHNSRDPSLNSFGLHLKVFNACGYVGAVLSDLFFQLFGLSAWLFVFGGFILSWRFFKQSRGGESLWVTGLFYFLSFASLCCLLNLYFPNRVFYEGVSLGGALGTVLLQVMTPLFHVLGTTLILCSILLLSFVFSGYSLRNGRFFTVVFHLFKNGAWLGSQAARGLLFVRDQFPSWLAVIREKMGSLKLLWGFLKPPARKLWKADNEDWPSPSDSDETFGIPASDHSSQDTSEDSPKEEEDLTSNRDDDAFEEEDISLSAKTFTTEDLPSLQILSSPPPSSKKISREEAQSLSRKLMDKLNQFSIKGQVTAIKTGPAVTLFEFRPDDNVKISRISEMANDISLALSSESVRIIAPIPGRDVVGIEASNTYRETVYLKTLLEPPEFSEKSLPLVLGRRADNEGVIEDLARIPHLLIAGTTGSGKSQFVISFITGLLFRHTPEMLKMILIDPKQVDLSAFRDVPHLLSPPITSVSETISSLRWAIAEMEKRYRSLARFGVRDLNSFNKIAEKLSVRERKEHEEWNQKSIGSDDYYYQRLPLICLIVEEFGDLMADPQFKRSIEMCVVRLAQKARASGIHLVLAMQSPRKDVITGLIKTNIPGRISFKVASGTDSRVILDEVGAERLLSHGDMLFLQPGASKSLRFHGPFISEEDVSQVVDHWKERGEPEYISDLRNSASKFSGSSGDLSDSEESDPMYEEILNYVQSCSSISASFLQRKFRIGYPRAARLIEILYEEGVIGPPQGSKPREVLGTAEK